MWLIVTIILSALSLVSSDFEGAIPTIDDLSACKPYQRPLYITEPYGYLVSPQYSESGLYPYPEGADCSWTLLAPENYVINMKMIRLDLDNWSDVTRISLYEGETDQDELIDTFTGTRWRNFRTQGNKLHIKFITGKRPSGVVPQYKGFKLYFEHNKAPAKCAELQLRCTNEETCITKDGICNGIDECRDGSDEQNCPLGTYNASECGFRSAVSAPQLYYLPSPFLITIVAGDIAVPNSWPWMISVRYRRNEPSGHYCGGSLISDQWVLTAAHCFLSDPDPQAYTIALGKHRSLIRDEREVTRYPVTIISHPNFDRVTKTGDLALVKLNAPISPQDFWISPVCLVDAEAEVEPGTMLTIVGWGDVQGTGNPYVLKEAMIPLVDNPTCGKWLQDPNFPDSLMCAGYEEGGTDTCKGDSGGPIMLRLEDKWMVFGVASYGLPSCGGVRQPGVYTRVQPHLDWIKETIKKKRLNTKIFHLLFLV